MKRIFFALFLLVSCLVRAVSYQSVPDIINAGNCYMEKNGKYYGVSRTSNLTSWSYDKSVKLIYGLHIPAGQTRAVLEFVQRSGWNAQFEVELVDPNTDKALTQNTVKTTDKSSGSHSLELFTDVSVDSDSWYLLKISSPNGTSSISSLEQIKLYRTSSLKIVDSEIFMAPSVHLWYSSTDSHAPSGESYDWFYHEVMIPSEYVKPYTYAMAIGGDGYYMGIQCNGDDRTGYNYDALFSVWDNGDTDSDPNLPDYMKSGALDSDSYVKVSRFGGEGTGTKSFVNNALWKPGQWVQFLINSIPESVTITSGGRSFTYYNTILSAWYKNESDKAWNYISSTRLSGKSSGLDQWYSFLENYTDAGGEMLRRAYWRNAYKHSALTDQWYHQNKTAFTNTQNNGNRNSRSDLGRGVTELYGNCFYMQTGGFLHKADSANQLPLLGSNPCVDTIQLAALRDRVAQAMNADARKQSAQQLAASSSRDDMLRYAQSLVDHADRLGGYASDRLQTVAQLLQGPNPDATKLEDAITAAISTSLPIKYAIISNTAHLSAAHLYNLSFADGSGCLQDDMLSTAVSLTPTTKESDLHNPMNAIADASVWAVTPLGSGYYAWRNLQSGRYLSIRDKAFVLSDEPSKLRMQPYGQNFNFSNEAGNRLLLQVVANYYMSFDGPHRTYNQVDAGNLSKVLDPNVTQATLSGQLNGTDIAYLRDLIKNHRLKSLDMSDATIVSGGTAYYQGYHTQDNTIGAYMFHECSRLESLKLPRSIMSVEERAFSGCNLKSVEIPDRVTTLGADAFSYNTYLREVTVGENVKSFGQGVFWSCNTANVYMHSTEPPRFAHYLFSSSPRVHVYARCKDRYEEAWSTRKSYNWDCTIIGDLVEADGIVAHPQQSQHPGYYYNLSGQRSPSPLPGLSIYYDSSRKKMVKVVR